MMEGRKPDIEKDIKIWKNRVVTALVYFAVITALYLLTRLRYESGQRQFSLKAYVMAAVLVVVTGMVHHKNRGARPFGQYLRSQLFAEKKGGRRIVYMDYIRVLAAVLVVVVHIMEPAYQNLESHTLTWTVMAVATSIFHSCNLLFLMISGALLLNGKDESIGTFYKKRFLKVAAPCFAYYCFYYFYFYGTSAFMPDRWGELIGAFTANSTGITPHFWLIHVILVFYIAAPFFSIMLKHMTEGQTGILAAVILILHCVYTYAPRFQINFVLTPFLASWESVFILGYFCTTKTAMQYYRFIMAGAGLSVVFIIYAVQNVSDFSALLYNNAPTMVMIAAAVFLFFRKHGNTLFSKDSRLLQTAGKYSFSILLIHWYILFEVVEKVFGLNGQSLGIVGGIILTAVLTLGASFLFAAVYDNTVVICLNGIIEAAIGIGKTKKQILRRKD